MSPRAGHTLKAGIGVGKEAEDKSLCILFQWKNIQKHVYDDEHYVYKRIRKVNMRCTAILCFQFCSLYLYPLTLTD